MAPAERKGPNNTPEFGACRLPTLLIETRFVPVLRNHFGRHCETEAELDDGRSRMRVAAPTPLDIARNLAGWGAMVEVLEPPAVQTELARIGAELAARYEKPRNGHVP